MADPPFVPTDFEPPTALVSDHFRLEPLGPQHNEADTRHGRRASPTSARPPGSPTAAGHRRRACRSTGTSTTSAATPPTSRPAQDSRSPSSAGTSDVIGCVYLYPSESADVDVTVQSWVRASHAELDVPLAEPSPPGWPPSGRGSACTAPAADTTTGTTSQTVVMHHEGGDAACWLDRSAIGAARSSTLPSRIGAGCRRTLRTPTAVPGDCLKTTGSNARSGHGGSRITPQTRSSFVMSVVGGLIEEFGEFCLLALGDDAASPHGGPHTESPSWWRASVR